MTDRPAYDRLPASLGQHYEIRAEIGSGASGTVYHAWDQFARRDVALKVAHSRIFEDSAEQNLVRKAWLNEVRLAGSLHHPYIVEVFDAGFSEDYAYLVMEYLAYGTLEPYTHPDKLKPVSEVLEIAYKCASALDYACQAGIVHRDVKPANLQLAGTGAAKVADFGAAYWSQGNDTTQVMDIGSLAYMAPELFRQWVTPQADIYALGVVLHQLLTGKRPFDGPDQATLMYRILNGERAVMTSYRPDLPESLNGLIDRMLARSLEDRFASWGQVLSALSMHISRAVAAQPAVAATTPADAELFAELRRLPLLAPLNDAQLWELLRISQWRKVKPGTVLMNEGGAAVSCYLLLQGEAKVTQKGRLIALLDAGTLFGELAFAEETPAPRAATVTTSRESIIGKWPYARLGTASPGLQSRMLQIFFRLAAERLRQSDERYLRLYRQLSQNEEAAP